MSEKEMRFGFGRNWASYIEKHFDENAAADSKAALLSFLKRDTLDGSLFLDIGCGSGLSSLAALRSGAKRVFSFDYDLHSVETTKYLKQYIGNPSNWNVVQGSILDDAFVDSLEPADIVYAWGVLHHTGDVWHALENTRKLMRPEGQMYIALYEQNVVSPSAEFWLDIKQEYNRGNWFTKRRLELWYIWRFDLNKSVRNLPTLIRRIRSRTGRGMAYYTDLVDWVGGWPMQFVKLEDVQEWVKKNNMEIINLNYGKQANTEYLIQMIKSQ